MCRGSTQAQGLIYCAGLQSVRRLQGILCWPTSHSWRSPNDPMMPDPAGLEGNKAWDSKHAPWATPPNISKRGRFIMATPATKGPDAEGFEG